MLPSRKLRICLFILGVACVVPSLSAVIAETREYHGKKVTCLHSGIFSSSGRVCGTQHYARVFTGTVQSAVEVGDTDKRLQLVQDEVFLGDSASEVTAIANQACLHTEIQAGDKWLFYLYRDGKGDELNSAVRQSKQAHSAGSTRYFDVATFGEVEQFRHPHRKSDTHSQQQSVEVRSRFEPQRYSKASFRWCPIHCIDRQRRALRI